MKKPLRVATPIALFLSLIWASSAQAQVNKPYTNNDATFLKCVYKISDDPLNVKSAAIWEADDRGNWITVPGRWHDPSFFARFSNFFTDVSQKELQQRCETALRKAGIRSSIVIPYAANNYASANNMFWSAEQEEDQNKSVDRLIIFGDSLTDSVNLFNETLGLGPNPEAWFHGHATNGKVWYEYLSELLGVPAYSWAYAGAMAEDKDFVIPLPGVVTPGIAKQTDRYLTASRDSQSHDPAKALSIFFFGGNDAVFNVSTPQHVIDTLKTNIDKILAAGGKKIVVANLPDISLSNIARNDGPENVQRVKDYVTRFNLLLKKLVEDYERTTDSSVHILAADIHTMFEDLNRNPAKYNIVSTTESCLDMTDFAQTISPLPVTQACREAQGRYLYWDIVHPTTKVHELMAKELARQIMPAGNN